MSKASVTSVIVLCAALAACSDSTTNRTLTAPDAARDLSEAPAGFAVTADGPFDVYFADDDGSAQLSAARVAAAQQLGNGSRASGHAAFSTFPPFLSVLAAERYSFVAQTTDASTPFAATGEFELMLSTVAGVEQKFHGDVICMSVVGNTARIAGQLEKVWINNVQRPITGATHVIWTVVDNGEGAGSGDTASPMFFNNAANAALHCTTGFAPVQLTPEQGNIQVQP